MSRVTYVTMDSVTRGVGASQVWPYVSRLAAAGQSMRVVSFEPPSSPTPVVPDGIEWTPRPFVHGRVQPLLRVVRAAGDIRAARRDVVHARSDLPALAAMLAGHQRWVWDVRSFWREQRTVLGGIAAGSATDRTLRRIEAAAATRSTAIICLAEAARETLTERYGRAVGDKVTVVPTVVDTNVFVPGPVRRGRDLRVLLSGSYNRFYDGVAMARLIEALRVRTPVRARWVGADRGSPWWPVLQPSLDEVVDAVPFAEVPGHVADTDVGLAVCRTDGGPALRAAMPTKIAEFLACGRPVVVSRGLGDMDALVADYRCGVVMQDASEASAARAADELLALIEDRDLSRRARSCAMDVFDLDAGIRRLQAIYDRVAAASSP